MGKNRESWLTDAVVEVGAILLDKTEIEIPEVRVSTGWPSTRGTSLKKRRIGECWKPEVASDGVSQVFISPVLMDPIQILGVLMHELIHAWDKCEHGHRGVFVKTAKAAGLVAPWTATGIDAELLHPLLEEIVTRLGKYPHSALNPLVQRKPQTTRQLKIEAEECGCVARTTRKYLDQDGSFKCPHDNEMIEEEK